MSSSSSFLCFLHHILRLQLLALFHLHYSFLCCVLFGGVPAAICAVHGTVSVSLVRLYVTHSTRGSQDCNVYMKTWTLILNEPLRRFWSFSLSFLTFTLCYSAHIIFTTHFGLCLYILIRYVDATGCDGLSVFDLSVYSSSSSSSCFFLRRLFNLKKKLLLHLSLSLIISRRLLHSSTNTNISLSLTGYARSFIFISIVGGGVGCFGSFLKTKKKTNNGRQRRHLN